MNELQCQKFKPIEYLILAHRSSTKFDYDIVRKKNNR